MALILDKSTQSNGMTEFYSYNYPTSLTAQPTS
jgi:hypothetical protein